MSEVGQLTREHWRGEWNGDYAAEGERPDSYRDYKGTVPLLATTLRLLAAHGPHGPVWWRYGPTSWQPLVEALDNPDDYRAYSVRDEARRKAQDAMCRFGVGGWVSVTACQAGVFPLVGC
ncbi:hypothetical protein ACH4C6_36310 [Streptomyces sp. NPDC017943]|uniref:hypothetical protein n=1 Tax=Streptomyces sp. NPDC017943 TaxID=3365019 RepID=UPI00378D2F5D